MATRGRDQLADCIRRSPDFIGTKAERVGFEPTVWQSQTEV